MKKTSSTLKCDDQILKAKDGLIMFAGKGVRLDGKPEKK